MDSYISPVRTSVNIELSIILFGNRAWVEDRTYLMLSCGLQHCSVCRKVKLSHHMSEGWRTSGQSWHAEWRMMRIRTTRFGLHIRMNGEARRDRGGSLGLGVMPPSPVILVVGHKIQKWKGIEVQLEVFVRWHILTRVLMSPSWQLELTECSTFHDQQWG